MGIFQRSKWIWADSNDKPNDFVIFRKSFKLDKPLKTAVCRAAADTKYFLSLNGKYVVFDGGLFRESTKGGGYYDEFDMAKYLTKGENVLSCVVWYYGNGGRNSVSSGGAGFLFECPDLELYSGETFTVFRNNAYCDSKPPLPSKQFAGHNIRYDATLESMLLNYQKPDYVSNIFIPASEYGVYPDAPWGELTLRTIPLFDLKPVVKIKKISKETNQYFSERYCDVYTADLGRAMNVYPYIEVFANSGDVIEIRSDRYVANGSYDDENMQYNGHRLEYICKAESQEFEFLDWVHAEKLYFYIPPSVKVLTLGYRECGYNSEETGYFKCGNDQLNTLCFKALNTLECCMRDNYMDSPERDRTMWPADSGIGALASYYVFDDNAALLAKKTILDVLNYAEDDIVYSNVPGNCPVEIPSQSLAFLSEFGLIADYYRYSGDLELIKKVYGLAIKYLSKWELSDDGLIKERLGNKAEFDHLYNVDRPLVLNCLYYSALKFARYMAAEAGDFTQADYLNGRLSKLLSSVRKLFDGVGYTSKNFYDDRANALAVLSGVAAEEEYPFIDKILASVYNATPFAESFVCAALGKTGSGDIALKRIVARYLDMIESESSTLREDFTARGNLCQLSSVSPLTFCYRYLAGIDFDRACSKVTLTPDMRLMRDLEFSCVLKSGKLSGKFHKGAKTEIVVDNNTSADVTLIVKRNLIDADLGNDSARNYKLGKGRTKITL